VLHLLRSRRLLAGLAAGLLATGTLAACGDDDDSGSSGSGETTTAAQPAGKKIKVGLVTDIGGLNDRSFNTLANKGLQDAKSQLGVEGRVLTSKSDRDYVPNLSSLAQQQYDLIIGVGFLMADAIDKVATKFPNVNFAIIDFPNAGLKHKPKNVRGLLFKEQEAGYLAGYLSGLYAKDEKVGTISSVGGQKIPPVDHYIAGYKAGAEAADPGIKTLNASSSSRDHEALPGHRRQRRASTSTCARGEVHALLGENGAGKSTLMNILYGLYRPTRARSCSNGKPVDVPLAEGRDRARDRHGAPALHADPGDDGRREHRARRRAARRAASLDDAAESRVRELSRALRPRVDPRARIEDITVGQQQRVEILKALYRGADILILDEPTAVLTPQEATSCSRSSRA
jgi:energy-coupling factor transporter ATP-binding protein EcfA2